MELENKIVGFIEVLIPITICNIKCHYCYIVTRGNRHMKPANFDGITPSQIAHALRPERFGGCLYISLCGAGETMAQKGLSMIVCELLKLGHIVNITTNGTITSAFMDIIDNIPQDMRRQLCFSFSYHIIELNRKNMKHIFWHNVNIIKDAGFSFIVQFNLCDKYEPYFDEIRTDCLNNVGALPQVAATRDEIDLSKDIRLFTKHTIEEYHNIGKQFNSPLFEYTMKNFMVKRKEFCYAGKYTYVLNLATGVLKPCYYSNVYQNIYSNPDDPIRLHAVGRHCGTPFCLNSSHFMSFGCIPEYKDQTSYGDLRNRVCLDGTEWYQPYFKKMVTQKLYDNVSIDISSTEKFTIELIALYNYVLSVIKKMLPRTMIEVVKQKLQKLN